MTADSNAAWLSEYDALRQGSGLADVSARSRVRLTGADRILFLNSFCTNDIKGLKPGLGCEAFLTNHQGKIVSHIFVRMLEDSLILDASPGRAAKIISHLDRFVISDRVEFHDLTLVMGELLLAGPQAAELLQQLSGSPLPVGVWQHSQIVIEQMPLSVQKADFLGDHSFFLTVPMANLAAVQAALARAGARHCGGDAVEALRLESGTPLYDRDITENNLPQEIGRDSKAVSFKKGCYLGQETVARIDALGHVNQLLVGLKFFSTDQPSFAGIPLTASGKPAGTVTSAAWSPQLQAPLAMALVRRSHTKAGTRLSSPLGDCEVVHLPLTCPADRC